jgi:type IV pilus assembly protein PilY1
MNIYGVKIKLVLVGLIYCLMGLTPAIADDIEIYTGTISSSSAISAKANILFVLDTSGSMASNVYTQPDYDPATTYSSCFDSNRIYTDVNFGGWGGLSAYCTSSGWGWWSSGYDITKLPQFNTSAFKCAAASTSMSTTGFYTDRVAQWRSSLWRDIDKSSVTSDVECKSDNGVHGSGATGLVWASNTDGPWSNLAANSVDWNVTGKSKTLYSGNYLNYLITAPVTNIGTRLSVMKKALTDVVNSASGINIGLMRYDSGGDGGMVIQEMGDISTSRSAFLSALSGMNASGVTPLSETFYEAVSYMQGNAVDYGMTSSPQTSVAASRTSGTATGTTYKSPIVNECQKNFIVLLTDGEPNNDDVSAARQANIGMTGGCVGNCLDEIAATIGNNDQSSVIDGDQFISTFTIGLSADISGNAAAVELLTSTAQASKTATGVGEFYPADEAITLTDAFSKIVTMVLDVDTTFSSPAVSVNAFNRATHLNDLFFTLFKPANNPHWAGNFKKYKLEFKKDAAGDLVPFIADASSAEAIDSATGYFNDSALSYWTPASEIDGATVELGGAAARLTNTRNVYTITGNYTDSSGVLVPDTPSLTADSNALDKTNADLTDALLGTAAESDYISGTPYRDSLIDWASGLDIKDINANGMLDDARLQVGDPLHAEPALVQYGELTTDSDGDGKNDPDLVAYVATNDGYLHAFNTLNGSEYFSFIPKEKLANLKMLFKDEGTSPKSYGLDGNVVAWINDIGKDGTISGSDSVYLYFGMRRGGRDIYSLDVTNRNTPSLRWIIKGGSGDYAELGQTWSTVNVEKLKLGGAEKTVLIFGGGYDENQDSATTRTVDTVGRAVYIVDADTGALLWRAGPDAGADLQLTSMKYSIPARIKPLDIDGDGFIDRLYAADMGGQIFRFDIEETSTGGSSNLATLVKGGRIADLSTDGSTSNTHRFYYPPDVALIIEPGKAPYLSLVAASGYRAHPLSTDVHDRIYMIRDKDVYVPPSSYVTITESDLYDTTLNLIGSDGSVSERASAKTSLAGAKGWYITLEETDGSFIGEKGLSEPLILSGTAIVTTYIPQDLVVDPTASICQPRAGTGIIYYLNVTDGTPTFNLTSTANDTKTREDRKHYLKRGGIPPSPSVIITEDGTPTICVGTECGAANLGLDIQKMYWYEVEQ